LQTPALQQQHAWHFSNVLKSDEKAKHELSIKEDCNTTTHTSTKSFLIMYKDPRHNIKYSYFKGGLLQINNENTT